jgi:glyoxylase-like metal-dependent hydrolase (beta-lactamase superfamily II)
MMQTIKIGEIKITRIVESVGPFLHINRMFPDATEEALEPYRSWLEPDALCPQTGKMILPVQSYLVRTPHHCILIDTCVGNHKSNSFFKPWHNMQSEVWLNNLRAANVTSDQIDYVLCSHLHLDHSGWNTRLIDGRWLPTFPNARYLFARQEYERAADIGGATFEENVVPVMEAGLGIIVEGDHAIDDHIWLEPTPGHTAGHVAIHLASNGQRGIMIGDIMHSPVQCEEPDWHAIADDDIEGARTTRKRIMSQHCDTGTLVMTAHFPSPSTGFLIPGDKAFRFDYAGFGD